MLYGLLLNKFISAAKDENIIIFESDTGMHLNQNLRLVVDINRMHFLCMNAGSITLASCLCPYMGPQNMIYFYRDHLLLRDFSEERTLFAGTYKVNSPMDDYFEGEKKKERKMVVTDCEADLLLNLEAGEQSL